MRTEPPLLSDPPAPPKPLAAPKSGAARAVRLLMICLLVALALGARYVLFKTPLGAKLQDHSLVLNWVDAHRYSAPLILVGAYVFSSVLMLPVWPIQLAAGYCFGIIVGMSWCTLGGGIGGVMALLLSRVLVGEWFYERYASRIAKLHAVSEKLGNNGLFVVMGVRLCHLLPFGISNYLFGLTRITVMNVAVGTVVGGIPALGAYVTVGAGRQKEWLPWTILAIINLILLIPLALRYYRPQWFSKSAPFESVSQTR